MEKTGHKEEKLEVCVPSHLVLIRHGTADKAGVLQGLHGLSRKDRLRWGGMHSGVGIFVLGVPWRLLKFLVLGE